MFLWKIKGIFSRFYAIINILCSKNSCYAAKSQTKCSHGKLLQPREQAANAWPARLAPGKNLASKSETSFRTLWQLKLPKRIFRQQHCGKLANIAWCYKFYLNSTPQFLLKWGVTPEEIPSRSKSGDEATVQWRIWSYAKKLYVFLKRWFFEKNVWKFFFKIVKT